MKPLSSRPKEVQVLLKKTRDRKKSQLLQLLSTRKNLSHRKLRLWSRTLKTNQLKPNLKERRIRSADEVSLKSIDEDIEYQAGK